MFTTTIRGQIFNAVLNEKKNRSYLKIQERKL